MLRTDGAVIVGFGARRPVRVDDNDAPIALVIHRCSDRSHADSACAYFYLVIDRYKKAKGKKHSLEACFPPFAVMTLLRDTRVTRVAGLSRRWQELSGTLGRDIRTQSGCL